MATIGKTAAGLYNRVVNVAERITKGRKVINIKAAYKLKARKVVPVNETDRTGEAAAGRRDWYKRAFE